MLVLTVKNKETCTATTCDGTVITVHVVQVSDGKVRLGFEAPDNCKIYRGVVQARIDLENATTNRPAT